MKKILVTAAAASMLSLTACPGDTVATRAPTKLPVGSYVAAVTTDYASTAISVLDATTGELVDESVYSSTTSDPGISLPLSGDVILPSSKPPDGTFLVIDRSASNVTLLSSGNMTVNAQIPVGQSSDGTWSANPHDAVFSVPTNRLYVTRFAANSAPSAGSSDMDEGDDIVIIDPDTQTVAKQIRFTEAMLGAGYRAAPDRMVDAGNYVVAVLAHYQGSGFSAAGDGLVAIISKTSETLVDADLGTGGKQLLRISEFNNCAGLAYSESERAVYVVCNGLFADGRSTQISKSGVVRVNLSALPLGEPTYDVVLYGSNAAIDQPLSTVEYVDSTTAFVLTYGNFDPWEVDQLFAFNPSNPAAAPVPVTEAAGAFELGALNYDPDTNTLYVADAPYGGPYLVRRYNVETTDASELDGTDPSPDNGLGPTSLGLFVVK